MLRSASLVVALCLLLAPPAAAQAQPHLIGVASVGLSPFGNGLLSGDGSILTGARPSGVGTEAVYWEVGTTGAEAVVVSLGTLLPPSGPPQTGPVDRAVAASGDGSVIVGDARNKAGQTEAFRWAGAGMLGLGFLAGQTTSTAVDVSADGSAVAGNSPSTGSLQAFVWNGAEMLQPLGDLEGGDVYSAATAISADGTVVVGHSHSSNGDEAFRWTEAGGMVGLGDLPEGTFQSIATDVSADGSVVVGWGRSADGDQAFLWKAATGMQPLPLPPGRTSRAWGVSPDGSVVLGEYRLPLSAQSAFVWDAVNGFRDLTQLLLDEGIVLDPDWVFPLQQALSISADGRVLRGTGTQNSVGFQDFVVTDLTTVPEPVAAGLAMAALAVLAGLATAGPRPRAGRA
jgi:probable HAF family extracellular repeat protein